MIKQDLEDNINFTRADARRRGLKWMTVEHLTLVLLMENSSVRQLLEDCHADVRGLTSKLSDFLHSNVAASDMQGAEPQPTPGLQRVLRRAVAQAQKRKEQRATGVHVLAAVFAEPNSFAAYQMQKYGVERLTVFANMAKRQPAPVKQAATDERDLVAAAAAGKLGAPFCRMTEIAAVFRALSRKYKNNPLLVGEPGVGKTALVHALAHEIAADRAPAGVANARLLQVSMTEMVAGTKYRGDFEQRLSQFVEKCRAHGNTIVFIDEIHTLVGAGAVSGAALDASNMLKPLLNEEGVRYIGATTTAEYRRIFEKESALSRRFQKIEVREPDAPMLRLILRDVAAKLSEHHQVTYADEAVEAAVALSARYLPNRFFPDKAIDLLDDAGAANRQPRQAAVGKNGKSGGRVIDKKEINAVALQMAGLPPQAGGNEKKKLGGLARQLSRAVFAQDEAAERLARAVLRARLEFCDGGKTVGAFLFTGPTGVGKTAMARRLAEVLHLPLLRYDMSEYMERHTVSRLIGAPPGYVGYEQSGKLIEDVASTPSAVVLFDEAEKAHPDVLGVLLQILDYGRLTGGNAATADFSNTVVILTSNAGAAEMERGVAGFDRDSVGIGVEMTTRLFPPEFRNRLDAVIPFNALSAATAGRIVDKELATLLQRVKEKKGITVVVGNRLRAALKRDGYSPTMGARPLQRLLTEKIIDPLALAEINGELNGGDRFILDTLGGDVVVRAAVRRGNRAMAVTARIPAGAA